ncbi:DUF3426 domain-containing protein [Marinobacterium sediminicola]|uniref:MJ0042 family finger-like domain-containing protein n=1 Tax=Marinobacterium sediminicola TaxID=518898 RepID=A0ABY1S000_9GAMM|nr:DUF3426 domain-containing protein [Marinobacterium sediminicola]ULG69945.1 DUF3426 domain-containing protein [Marinobacterium sediminicola]SMR74395.1 MJ0042 family finger-like domain-containing protein [Marinobacterium sediminicola]
MVITRCPECHARFRVTDGQLKLARGQVRCGACLCVFDAIAHAQPATSPQPVRSDAEHVETSGALTSAPATDTPDAIQTPATPDIEASLTEQPAPPSAQADEQQDKPAEENASLPFSAEPIALSGRNGEDNPVATTGWLLLSMVALLALAAQLLWFERARLAEYPQLGSIYALLCEQVDCSLTQSAFSLIDNQGLHLQPHPKYSDALNATILLENRAAFSQPWPGLQLRFTDLKGRLVAQRTFQPEEYLDISSVDPLRMPTRQPVQIELELASPGRRGISYELKLAPATPIAK